MGMESFNPPPVPPEKSEEELARERQAEFKVEEPEPVKDEAMFTPKQDFGIYEKPEEDPVIKEVEENITRITNQRIEQSQQGVWGKEAQRESGGTGYTGAWNRENKLVDIQQWDKFLDEHPKEAEAYREFEPISQAFERQKRKFLREEEERIREMERPKTIDDDPEFKGFMNNEMTGLNARVWEGVSREKSLTTSEYDEKAKRIREEMTREFATQHPGFAEKYDLKFEEEKPVQTQIEPEIGVNQGETIGNEYIESEEQVEELRDSNPLEVLNSEYDSPEEFKEKILGELEHPENWYRSEKSKMEFLKKERDFRKAFLKKIEENKYSEDRDFMKKVFESQPDLILEVPDSIKNDREFNVVAVAKNPRLYKHIPESLKKDKELAVAAMKKHWPEMYESVPGELQNDKDVITAMINTQISGLSENDRRDRLEQIKRAMLDRKIISEKEFENILNS